MEHVTEILDKMGGLGFERVSHIPGSTFRDQSTFIIMPSREELIHYRVTAGLYSLISPMNQKRGIAVVTGHEVGVAYNTAIQNILDNPALSQWKYVLTVETDNLVPPTAHVRLLETIEAGQWDAVGGLYFTKGEINMPMAYGDPARFESTGELEFTPRDVASAVAAGQVMPVNGVAMGCTLWRLELFRALPPPWFVTVNDVIDGQAQGFTQDLYFCKRARMAGRRFAVDTRVRVGHLDLATGDVY
jgi:hypothetical protein